LWGILSTGKREKGDVPELLDLGLCKGGKYKMKRNRRNIQRTRLHPARRREEKGTLRHPRLNLFRAGARKKEDFPPVLGKTRLQATAPFRKKKRDEEGVIYFLGVPTSRKKSESRIA